MVAVADDASCYFCFLKSETEDGILEVMEVLRATGELTGNKGRRVGLEFGVSDMLNLRWTVEILWKSVCELLVMV